MNNWKKGKIKSDFASSHIYDYYKKTHTTPLSRRDFGVVCDYFNKRIIEEIYKGTVFMLPGGIGMIGIKASKVTVEFTEDGEVDLTKSTLSTDWQATNKLWKQRPELKNKKYIFYDNYHTEGKRYKIAWSRRHCNIPSAVHYRFLPSRSFKRNLAKYIKNNLNQEYYEF